MPLPEKLEPSFTSRSCICHTAYPFLALYLQSG